MSRKKILAFLFFIVTLKEVVSNHDDVKCDQHLEAFTKAFQQQEPWALGLLDSWGKLNPGYLEGNTVSYGSLYKCSNFSHTLEDDDTIDGQYCLVSWSPSAFNPADLSKGLGFEIEEEYAEKLKIVNAVCIPKTCSPEKVLAFVNQFLNPMGLKGVEARCRSISLPFDNFDIAAITICSIVGILLLVSTSYDLIIRRNTDEQPHKLLISFSVYTNGKNLFRINRKPNSKIISCFDGLKVMSCLLVILVHRMKTNLMSPPMNRIIAVDKTEADWIMVLAAATMVIETFLVISAVLSTMKILDLLEKKAYNPWTMIASRYMRYTPLLAATIFIFTSILRHSNVAFRDYEDPDYCTETWWLSLLQIQNYVRPEKICIGHSWYLAVDFQLFVISPLLIYPATKFGWKYLWLLPTMTLMGALYMMKLCLDHNFNQAMPFADMFSVLTAPTHVRGPPFFIGIVLGYVLYQMRNKEIKINKYLDLFIWIVVIIYMSLLMLVHIPATRLENSTFTTKQSALLKGFMPMCWSLGLCWIIFACHKLKSGGPIRWILSLPEWQPLSRMALTGFILSVMHQRWSVAVETQSYVLGNFLLIQLFLGDCIGTFILSVVFYLAVEMPFVIAFDYCISRPQKKVYKLQGPTKNSDKRL